MTIIEIAAADHPTVVLDADLAVGESVDLGGELLARPGAPEVGVDPVHDPLDVRIIRELEIAQAQAVLVAVAVVLVAASHRNFFASSGSDEREYHACAAPLLPLRGGVSA
ncbi:MAG: hypothetical protein U5L11_08100 [Arhodomonas sp.]|nr:hypothetical protein [Arhodomonas sp.]